MIAEVADDLDPDLAATTEEGLDPMTDTEEAIEDGTIPTQTALDLPKEITEDGKTAALDLTIAVTETIDALTAANVQEVLVIVEIKVGTETNSLAVMEESSPAHQSDAPKVLPAVTRLPQEENTPAIVLKISKKRNTHKTPATTKEMHLATSENLPPTTTKSENFCFRPQEQTKSCYLIS